MSQFYFICLLVFISGLPSFLPTIYYTYKGLLTFKFGFLAVHMHFTSSSFILLHLQGWFHVLILFSSCIYALFSSPSRSAIRIVISDFTGAFIYSATSLLPFLSSFGYITLNNRVSLPHMAGFCQLSPTIIIICPPLPWLLRFLRSDSLRPEDCVAYTSCQGKFIGAAILLLEAFRSSIAASFLHLNSALCSFCKIRFFCPR